MKIKDLSARVVAEGPDLSDEAICAFAADLGFNLPLDYSEFLHRTKGGGTVTLGSVEYLEFKKSKMNYSPEIFCAPGNGGYHHIRSLQQHLIDLEHPVSGVPAGIFTIADDMFGNFLTIDLREETFGQIAVVNHETVGDDFNDPETYQILASSFSEFAKFCR
jgi:SMI1 / KNR4 family (SUKH-1)